MHNRVRDYDLMFNTESFASDVLERQNREMLARKNNGMEYLRQLLRINEKEKDKECWALLRIIAFEAISLATLRGVDFFSALKVLITKPAERISPAATCYKPQEAFSVLIAVMPAGLRRVLARTESYSEISNREKASFSEEFLLQLKTVQYWGEFNRSFKGKQMWNFTRDQKELLLADEDLEEWVLTDNERAEMELTMYQSSSLLIKKEVDTRIVVNMDRVSAPAWVLPHVAPEYHSNVEYEMKTALKKSSNYLASMLNFDLNSQEKEHLKFKFMEARAKFPKFFGLLASLRDKIETSHLYLFYPFILLYWNQFDWTTPEQWYNSVLQLALEVSFRLIGYNAKMTRRHRICGMSTDDYASAIRTQVKAGAIPTNLDILVDYSEKSLYDNDILCSLVEYPMDIITLVSRAYSEARMFPTWSMGSEEYAPLEMGQGGLDFSFYELMGVPFSLRCGKHKVCRLQSRSLYTVETKTRILRFRVTTGLPSFYDDMKNQSEVIYGVNVEDQRQVNFHFEYEVEPSKVHWICIQTEEGYSYLRVGEAFVGPLMRDTDVISRSPWDFKFLGIKDHSWCTDELMPQIWYANVALRMYQLWGGSMGRLRSHYETWMVDRGTNRIEYIPFSDVKRVMYEGTKDLFTHVDWDKKFYEVFGYEPRKLIRTVFMYEEYQTRSDILEGINRFVPLMYSQGLALINQLKQEETIVTSVGEGQWERFLPTWDPNLPKYPYEASTW